MSALKSAAIAIGLLLCLLPRISSAKEIVVLLHGIANVPLSMKYLESHLEDAGYRVYNLGYPSTDETIEKAAAQVRKKVTAIEGADRINFVGHSMGNLVIRMMLGESLPGLGRIVMIAPPNRGSLVAKQLEDLDIYRWIFGPAGQELPADNKAFFDNLPVPKCEFGIIAGGRGNDEGYNPLLPGDDDGTVAVEETKLPGAADFILINRTHTLILFDPETVKQTISFLKTGHFQK
jgi:pimeloyl-ACP methyl ester carboxylesterase